MKKRTKIMIAVVIVFLACAVIGSLLLYKLPEVLFYVAGRPVRIEGEGMSPALNDGDRVMMTSRFDPLARGEIIIFYYPGDTSKSYIKRIIGLPGEEIEIDNGKVLINGQIINEPYLNPNPVAGYQRVSSKTKIAENNYFVLGDNRNRSSDSRDWGTVPYELIYGKFVNRYYVKPQLIPNATDKK
jgi:signal peptidase I